MSAPFDRSKSVRDLLRSGRLQSALENVIEAEVKQAREGLWNEAWNAGYRRGQDDAAKGFDALADPAASSPARKHGE